MKNEQDIFEAPILQLVETTNPVRIYVAYSGGVDSSVLLDVLVKLKTKGLFTQTISAIHINHNLHPKADLWAEHCQARCAELGVTLKIIKVKVDKTTASLEAQARSARYKAFSKILGKKDALFLAQHQDDQVETVFLRLLRGAGAHGLSAMHAIREFNNAVILRPWLDLPKSQILNYAQAHKLSWIEDASNQDTKMDRNFLRHKIIPQLKTRWPGLNTTVSRTAKLLKANQASLLPTNFQLPLEDLNQLETDQAANKVHQWLLNLKAPLPSYKKIVNIATELANAVDDAMPHVSWNGGEVRRYAGKLYYFADKQSLARVDFVLNLTGAELLDKSVKGDFTLFIKEPETLNLELHLKRLTSPLSLRVLPEDKITIKFLQGGEKIKPHLGQHTKKLKKIFQERKIPPWVRNKIPLIFINEELAQVVGICIAADFALKDKETGVQISMVEKCEQ